MVLMTDNPVPYTFSATLDWLGRCRPRSPARHCGLEFLTEHLCSICSIYGALDSAAVMGSGCEYSQSTACPMSRTTHKYKLSVVY